MNAWNAKDYANATAAFAATTTIAAAKEVQNAQNRRKQPTISDRY